MSKKNQTLDVRYEFPSGTEVAKQTFVTTLAATVGTVAAMAAVGAAAAGLSTAYDKFTAWKDARKSSDKS